MTSVFAESPSRRRVLLVLDSASYAQLSAKELASLERGGDVQVVHPIQAHGSQRQPLVTRLLDEGLLAAGRVLVQSPFQSDVYVDAHDATSSFALEKASIVSRLCQYLGARSIDIKVRRNESVHDRQKGSAKFRRAAAVDADGGAESDRTDLADSLIGLSDNFRGAGPNVEQAQSLLVARNLTGDPVLTDLVAGFGFGDNPMSRRELLVSLTQEANRRLETWLDVDAGVGPVKTSLKGRYDALNETRREVNVAYKIEFGPPDL